MDQIVKGARTVVFLAGEVKKKVRQKCALSLSQLVATSYYLRRIYWAQFFVSKGVFYVVNSALLFYVSNRNPCHIGSHNSRSEISHAGRCAPLE